MRKIIMASITAVVVIAVLAGTLIPVLDDATAKTDTFTNEGAFYVEVDPASTYTIEYDKSTKLGVVVINDVDMEIPFSTGYTILAIDDAILRLQSGDYTLQYKGDGSYLTGITALDIEISNGSVTGTYYSNGQSHGWPTTTYTKAFVASPTSQDNVMTEYNTVSKMNGDSNIFAFGQTLVGTTVCLMKIVGSIDDSVTVSVLNATSGQALEGAVVSNLSINATADSDYIDLYDLTSITFTVTLADSSTADVTYSAYIVPSEVTAERAVHFTDGENAIFNAIPVIVIVALLLGVVAIVLRSRMD